MVDNQPIKAKVLLSAIAKMLIFLLILVNCRAFLLKYYYINIKWC